MFYARPNANLADAQRQVITLALRTAMTKAKKGFLKDTKLEDLLILILTVIRVPKLTSL